MAAAKPGLVVSSPQTKEPLPEQTQKFTSYPHPNLQDSSVNMNHIQIS